ncbi:MAG: MoaD/ThiS family protein [Desulfobacterales bacterium]|nr:MAG: MoaD/ThiS family protein [Desulfobacterales bacterium]
MRYHIYVHGFLKNVVPPRFRRRPVSLESDAPLTVYKMLTAMLGIKTLDATVLVKGKIVSSEYALQDGDEVHIYSPIAGG